MKIKAIVRFKHEYALNILEINNITQAKLCDLASLNSVTLGNFLNLKQTQRSWTQESIFKAFQLVNPEVEFLKLFPPEQKKVVSVFKENKVVVKDITPLQLEGYKTELVSLMSSPDPSESVESDSVSEKMFSVLKKKFEKKRLERPWLKSNVDRNIGIFRDYCKYSYSIKELSDRHKLGIEGIRMVIAFSLKFLNRSKEEWL